VFCGSFEAMEEAELTQRVVSKTNQYYALVIAPGEVNAATPTALLDTLLTEVTGVGPGTSLADKVKFAQTYYAVPDIQATCAVLTGFVNEVKAQAGKKIAPPLDAKLIADAQAIWDCDWLQLAAA
jgi:hypothetical protein